MHLDATYREATDQLLQDLLIGPTSWMVGQQVCGTTLLQGAGSFIAWVEP